MFMPELRLILIRNSFLGSSDSLVFSDLFFFFFQAEDGIRDLTETGVQTCALPICDLPAGQRRALAALALLLVAPVTHRIGLRLADMVYTHGCIREPAAAVAAAAVYHAALALLRSGERRVGEEGRSRWSPDYLKKKK